MSNSEINQTDQLTIDISNSIETGKPASGFLGTNDRIISRVTDGIYREPWSAFRELVSNAYDADATKVSINSDFPFFDEIRISDNGNGMDKATVSDLLTNIGGSSKRTLRGKTLNTVSQNDATKSPGGRKLIGKIGVGIFAVAQITNHFQIITKRKGSDERVSATVKINTYREDALATEDETNFNSGQFEVIAEKTTDLEQHGTTIVLLNVQRGVKEKLQSREVWDALEQQEDAKALGVLDTVKAPKLHIGQVGENRTLVRASALPWTNEHSPLQRFNKLFEKTIDLGRNSIDRTDLSHLDNYLKMVWRLSLGSPIRYLDNAPFDFAGDANLNLYRLSNKSKGQAEKIVLKEDETLRHKLGLVSCDDKPVSDFSVHIDGIELRRPVKLPEQLHGTSKLKKPALFVGKATAKFSNSSLDMSGGTLSFEAYMYWNDKIVPKESIGALIRVNGASGTLFDPDFLGYAISEQTRKKQITCEIFVLEGLDGALNIDRESYNTSHPHYLYIQKWLHNAFRQFATQNKREGAEVRKEATEKLNLQKEERVKTISSQAWERMRGEDQEQPNIESNKYGSVSLPAKIGVNELHWDPPVIEKAASMKTDKVDALSIILEAYGVFDSVSYEQRSNLIFDIISLFEDDS